MNVQGEGKRFWVLLTLLLTFDMLSIKICKELKGFKDQVS